MDSISTNIFTMGLLFVGLFLSGFWLNRKGKPYPAIFFNLHKFIGLGAAVYLGVRIYRAGQPAPLGTAETAAVVVTAVLFAVTIVAGGLLNTAVPRQKALLTVHHIFPYLTVLSAVITLYLLF